MFWKCLQCVTTTIKTVFINLAVFYPSSALRFDTACDLTASQLCERLGNLRTFPYISYFFEYLYSCATHRPQQQSTLSRRPTGHIVIPFAFDYAKVFEFKIPRTFCFDSIFVCDELCRLVIFKKLRFASLGWPRRIGPVVKHILCLYASTLVTLYYTHICMNKMHAVTGM